MSTCQALYKGFITGTRGCRSGAGHSSLPWSCVWGVLHALVPFLCTLASFACIWASQFCPCLWLVQSGAISLFFWWTMHIKSNTALLSGGSHQSAENVTVHIIIVSIHKTARLTLKSIVWDVLMKGTCLIVKKVILMLEARYVCTTNFLNVSLSWFPLAVLRLADIHW